MPRAHRRSATALRLLVIFALVTGLAACGDDDDATDTGAGTEAEGDAAGDVDTYCEKTVEIETLPEPDIDFEALSEEELAAEVKAFATTELVPLAAEIEAAAPAEVEADIAVLVAAVDDVAETGDFEGSFETPEVEAASDRVHAFDLENCGWNRVDVTAREYAFEGIDEELDAGVTSFEFTNGGQEVHEMSVVRKKDDTTESFDELLEMSQEEADAKIDFVAHTFGEPGDEEYVVADLTAGEYIALCFIPVGSTPEAGEDVEGPPHFTQGMRVEFTVS
jgi:hypothetical protein